MEDKSPLEKEKEKYSTYEEYYDAKLREAFANVGRKPHEEVMENIKKHLRELEDMQIVIFFRGDMFYPTEYPLDFDDWQGEADHNPGTTKIETLNGDVLWTT